MARQQSELPFGACEPDDEGEEGPVVEQHFVVEKLTTPVPVHHNASKQWLRWGVTCSATGGRFAARKTRAEAETMAGMYGRSACWLCDEAARRDGVIKPVEEGG